MFGPAYFGVTYYGPTFFGPGVQVEEPTGGSGRFYPDIRKLIERDIKARDYRRKEKRQGLRTPEITPKKVLRELDRELLKAKLKEFRGLDVPAPEARALLEAHAETLIEQARTMKVEQLNQETLAMILAAIMADE